MKTGPYARFKKEELLLRDYLALDRTVLANERTFLSYTRTALAFAGGGVGIIYFLDSAIAKVVGGAVLPIAVLVFLAGAVRYHRMRRRLSQITKADDDARG